MRVAATDRRPRASAKQAGLAGAVFSSLTHAADELPGAAGPVEWTMALGLGEASHDTQKRLRLIALAAILRKDGLLREAAESDPDAAVRAAADAVLSEPRRLPSRARWADLAPTEPQDFATKLLGHAVSEHTLQAQDDIMHAPWDRAPFSAAAHALLREADGEPIVAWRCACMLATPGLTARTAVDRAMLVLERELGDGPRRLTAAIAPEEQALLARPIAEPFDVWLARYIPAMSIATSGQAELRGDIASVIKSIDWSAHAYLRKAITGLPTRVVCEHALGEIVGELLLVAATRLVLAPQRLRINVVLWGARTLSRFPHHQEPVELLDAAWRVLAAGATHA